MNRKRNEYVHLGGDAAALQKNTASREEIPADQAYEAILRAIGCNPTQDSLAADPACFAEGLSNPEFRE